MAAEELESFGLSTTVADARFAKPLDQDLIDELAQNHEVLVTVEEGSVGGFGSHVAQYLNEAGHLDEGKLRFRSIFMPDIYLDQASPNDMNESAGLNSGNIVKTVFAALGRDVSEEKTIA